MCVGELLHFDEAAVESFCFGTKQFFVCAAFDDVSVVKHADEVGSPDCRKTVSDDKGGAPLHKSVERLLYEGLALTVERRRCFVENENRRVAEHGAGDRDALALTAGEAAAAVAYHGVVALVGGDDEVVGIGDAGGTAYVVESGVFDAEGYVVENCVVEQNCFLIDVANGSYIIIIFRKPNDIFDCCKVNS